MCTFLATHTPITCTAWRIRWRTRRAPRWWARRASASTEPAALSAVTSVERSGVAAAARPGRPRGGRRARRRAGMGRQHAAASSSQPSRSFTHDPISLFHKRLFMSESYLIYLLTYLMIAPAARSPSAGGSETPGLGSSFELRAALKL